jgi:hypothetical protein
MSVQKESSFNDLFNVSPPWEITVLSYSKQNLLIKLKIDYNNDVVNCPVCKTEAKISTKNNISFEITNYHFGYNAKVTACIPLVEPHNINCRVDRDQTVLSNTLLLDLILYQLKNTGSLNPFRYLFKSANLAYSQLSH